jgi:catalase
MAIHHEAPPDARPRLSTASTLARFALLGVILAAVVAIFAYLGGWLTPNELTPARLTDGFEEVGGVHPGFRRNHAKGVGVLGFFESNGNGVRLSKAAVFGPGRVPVIGRFSLAGPNPNAPDTPDAVRGLGLQFSPPGSEVWRTAMISLPVFPVSTPQAFYEQLIASKPDPATGKPDPAKMKAFVESHPENEEARKIIKNRPISSGFENSTFHSLNAFWFTNAAGDSIPVRWILTPAQPLKTENTARAVVMGGLLPPPSQDKNFLFDALIAAMHRPPARSLRWHLIVIIGRPGDPTNNAAVVWPKERESVDVGTLTLDQVESDDTSPATCINFDPLVLPYGMAPSDDPLLSARSAVYSQSYTRRAGEPKEPAAVTPAEGRKGG